MLSGWFSLHSSHAVSPGVDGAGAVYTVSARCHGSTAFSGLGHLPGNPFYDDTWICFSWGCRSLYLSGTGKAGNRSVPGGIVETRGFSLFDCSPDLYFQQTRACQLSVYQCAFPRLSPCAFGAVVWQSWISGGVCSCHFSGDGRNGCGICGVEKDKEKAVILDPSISYFKSRL